MAGPSDAQRYVNQTMHRDVRRVLIRVRDEGMSLGDDKDVEEITDRIADLFKNKRAPRA